MKDVMLDIETLGVRSTSAIIQIGACYFDRETGEIGEEFIVNLSPDTNKFTVDYSTIKWWVHQPEEARNSVFLNGMSPDYAAVDFKDFLSNAKYLWSHATFDVPIVLNMFDVYGIDFPIHYTKMRDIRTLMDLADHRSKKERDGIHHHALDDCKFQVAYCVEAMNKLKNI